MSRHDEAAIAVGVFVFLFVFLGNVRDRKSATTIQFARGLMKYRIVPKKPTTVLQEMVYALAAGAVIAFLLWSVD